MKNYEIEHGSFRDRNSKVFYNNGTVFRVLSEQALKEWKALSSTTFFKQYMDDGKLIHTEQTDASEKLYPAIIGEWAATLKHQTIPFISYPYEWSFGMLKDAALLQLELLLVAIDEGIILKDSSAFNFQWLGVSPIFIDIPSFEKLADGEPWVGYRQFCQMFLYPLFLQAYKDIPFHPWLRGNIDGIDPEHCNHLMSVRDLLRSGVFMHVYLQAKMQARYAARNQNIKGSLRTAGFKKEMIKANVNRLSKIVRGLTWKRAKSEWSDYASNTSYLDSDRDMKMAFVRNVVMSRPWNLVWDLGCNIGIYSRIAAENSKYVVAMDADNLTIEHLFQTLKTERNKSILPLISNIANPSPNLGWRGLERKSLVERGKPDLTLCLALIHHIVISANIPLKEFINWIASMNTYLVIEFVTKEDQMVKTLLRNKDDNYNDYELEYFEKCLSEAFDVNERKILTSGTRILYFAQVKRLKP
ncbi:MAG: methyltransferase [Candidatus Scalinduaceae bacterium]